MRDDKNLKIIVVGADWYGDWAKYLASAFKSLGFDTRLIYTNSLLLSSKKRASGGVYLGLLERGKHILRKVVPSFFKLLKKIRRRLAEKNLVRLFSAPEFSNGKTLVFFVWTPPEIKTLRELKKIKGIKLNLWMGESIIRDRTWEGALDYFDHIFTLDETWVGLFGENILGKIAHKLSILPHASNHLVYRPIEGGVNQKYCSDIAFVGHYEQQRAEKLSVFKDYDLKIYGFWWEGGFSLFPWLKEKYCGSLTAEEVNFVLNSAKVNIGSLHVSQRSGDFPVANQRVFDIALARGFQLSEYSPQVELLFGDNVKTFKENQELKKLADYYLGHSEERRFLAQKAYEIALGSHTYISRAKEFLRINGFEL